MSAARLRCDPTDYARKQQEKKDRAKDLKEQRSKGVVADDHTFAPKVNPRARGGAPSSREEDERPSAMLKSASAGDDVPIRPSKTLQATRHEILAPDEPSRARKVHGNGTGNASGTRPNNNEDHHGHGTRDVAGDALDSLSRKFPKKTMAASREPEDVDAAYASPAPEHDALYREVKRATGHGIEDIPIAKLTGGGGASKGGTTKHTGPCLRNSSCACPQCTGLGVATRPDPPVRRRESVVARPPPESDAFSPSSPSTTSRSSYGAQSEMENSLTLLKSKMSRRKARTAPSNQASLLYDDAPPPREPASKSARLPSTHGSSSSSSSSTAATRRTEPPPNARASMSHAPAARKPPPPQQPQQQSRLPRHQEEDDDQAYARPPPPISSGAQLPDEYADDVEEMAECGNCHRRFNVVSFAKHQKICEKVFSGPRKVFDMTAKRLEGTEAEKLLKQAAGGKKGKKNNAAAAAIDDKPIRAKAVDWKQQSNAFRDAMRANRDIGQAIKDGKPLPPMAPSAPDPSLIPCDYCGRRFNDKAADRHIAFCKEKAQRSGGGPPPKKPAAAGPAAKSSAAASKAPPRKR